MLIFPKQKRNSLSSIPRGPRLDTEVALHHVMAQGMEACDFLLSDTDHEDLVKRMTEITAKTRTVIQA
jgi:hypothetical protein